MPWAAAAAVVAAGIGAASSNKASKEQSKGIQKGIDASAALAQQARGDVMKLWQQGSTQGRAGIEGAFNFYKQAAPQRMAPVTQGFQQGINVLGQGAQQANNAILGLPVDMGFTNQQVAQAPTGYLDQAKLTQAPMLGAQDLLTEQPTVDQNQSANANPSKSTSKLDKIEDPLGLKDPIVKKIESKDPVRKLIKKLF